MSNALNQTGDSGPACLEQCHSQRSPIWGRLTKGRWCVKAPKGLHLIGVVPDMNMPVLTEDIKSSYIDVATWQWEGERDSVEREKEKTVDYV